MFSHCSKHQTHTCTYCSECLREALAEKEKECERLRETLKTVHAANLILMLLDSSPTEFEAVRKCPECDYGWVCKHCNSTGEIVRPMTQKEVMEWAEGVAECGIEWPNTLAKTLINLSSGERVRRKE